MALSEIVDVQISRDIPVVDREGFGTPLFLTEDAGESGMEPGEVRSYGDLEELEEDFASGDAAYEAAQTAFSQGSGLSTFKVSVKDTEDSWVDALAKTIETDDNWYCLIADTSNASDIEDIAENVEARGLLYIARSADSDIKDSQVEDDIASKLLDKTLSRTALFYHSQADSAYPDAALAGKQLPEDPGATTWSFKSLSGITTDSFTSGERQALRDKRATHYISVAGNAITYEGYTSEPGVFIDVIRGLDWLEQRMSEDVFAALSSAPKIPYVGGGEILEDIIRSRLDDAVQRDIIVEDFDVDVPAGAEQDESDRADRHFPGIEFSAQLTGSIHSVRIRGTVTV